MTRRQRARNRKGSNQYRSRPRNHWKWYLTSYLLGVLVLIFTVQIIRAETHEALAKEIPIVSPLPSGQASQVEEQTDPSPEDVHTQEEIEEYIRHIFGRDANVARAIHYNECNPANALYPYCDKTITDHEYSVGIFQINIMSKTTKVHWHRIPGEELEEKVEWLRDPFNNTLMAYWIYKTSGWFPWSAYTSGNYLNDL